MAHNSLYRDGQYKCFLAKDLDQAYDRGYFSGSMRRDELVERIQRYNPTARLHSNATHRGLFIEGKFICGIAYNSIIPKYSIMEYDTNDDKKLDLIYSTEIVNQHESEYKVLARGWLATMAILKKRGYQVNERGL